MRLLESKSLRARYPTATEVIERWSSATVGEFSSALWRRSSVSAPIEGKLVASFRREFERTYPEDPRVDVALATLRRYRLLGTTTHVAPSYGPIFLAADHLLTVGAPEGVVAIAGVWTGVPFNNSSRPGCLTFTCDPKQVVRPGSSTWRRLKQSALARAKAPDGHEWRLALVPVRAQHHLVYRHPIPAGLGRTLDDLQPTVRAALSGVEVDDEFPDWALRSTAAVSRQVLASPPLHVDLNRVIARYLLASLDADKHPLTRLLLDPGIRSRLQTHPAEPWFYGRGQGSRGERLSPLVPRDDRLVGPGLELPLTRDALVNGLVAGDLCPALFLTYTVLCGLNAIVCAGGLRQIEYMQKLATLWRSCGFGGVSDSEEPRLLVGRLVRERGPAHALDLAIEGLRTDALVPARAQLSSLWDPLVDVL